jgi:hypothetical protein
MNTTQQTSTAEQTQIFFSRRCPLLNWRLPLLHKILYTNGACADAMQCVV